jgi:calcineurin-like phosphoesterase family protein
LNFKDKDDNLIRGSVFKSIEEHDETIIARHNSLVHPSDRVYLLGDICISRRSVQSIGRLIGRLVLVKGNHDIFKLNEYLPYFDDIRSYVVQKDKDGNKVILSHIPIHPESLGRWGTNIHGHLHQNSVGDPNYICVSLEHTDYKPIEVQEALKLRGLRK